MEVLTRTAKLRITCDCGCKQLMGRGTQYTMIKKDGWHYIFAQGCYRKGMALNKPTTGGK